MISNIPRWHSLLFCLLFLPCLAVPAENFTHAAVLCSPAATSVERKAIAMLLDESSRRTGVQWQELSPAIHVKAVHVPILIVGQRDQIVPLLAPISSSAVRRWNVIERRATARRPEGFRMETIKTEGHTLLIIAGNDSRGILFGAGQLLRTLAFIPGHAELPHPIHLITAPDVPIRGHQIGYRFKNNTYDAWTLSQFEQHIRDLAIFGANSIQLITPESDDAPTSPLYPAPALGTLVGISQILKDYGLDCDLYFPEIRKDYSDPATVQAQLDTFAALVRQMPRIDALYVPGGDPGHTEPRLLFPLVEKEAAILHRYHPRATVWISAQGFNAAWYEQFYALLDQQPIWLNGIFFGPQSRDSFPAQRARIPTRYPLLFYPDIAHTMHSQFPVPGWDPAFALSEGREPINPRPLDETHIYRHFAPLHRGFITYSEGANDDVNKFVWTRLGWSADTPPRDTLREYSRFFLGSAIGTASSDRFADVLLALEANWRGPATANSGIARTLEALEALDRQGAPEQLNNWRFEEALYRATYDALIQQRLRAETAQQDQALDQLRQAPTIGTTNATKAALMALQPTSAPDTAALRARLLTLADSLFRHIGLQLSVTRYGASGIERGANLDRMDVSLNDRVWLTKQLDQIAALPTESERLRHLDALVHWSDPVAGTLYDDLGDPQREPHLVHGTGFESDPELYATAIDSIADRTPDDGWRLSWLTYAETLYETPTELRYTGLDPGRQYHLRVTYAGEGYTVPVRLVANDTLEIQPPTQRSANPSTVELTLPAEATRTGTLSLKWSGLPNLGGGGRGHQIAEVWLIPQGGV